ncbi:MAG: Ig-like domain-containing protein, partial [Terracidiphilus sp.]
MSKFGRNLISSFKTLALATLAVVAGPWNPAQAAAQGTISPSAYSFGNVAVSQPSQAEKFTFKNTGASSITIHSYSVTGGPYQLAATSNECPQSGSLGAGASCFIAVTVEPGTLGVVPAGTLTVNSTASNTPQKATLSATAVAPVTLSAAQLSFQPTVIGFASNTLDVLLTNNQATSVTVTGLSVTTANGYALTPATICSGTAPETLLTAHSSCTIAVNVTPNIVGVVPASTLSVTTTQSATPITIPLTETARPPTVLSLTNVPFAPQVVNQPSPVKTVTLTNWQPTAITISSITPPAGYAITSATTCANDTFPGTLAAGASCTIDLDFTPTAIGATPGDVTVTTNASNSPQMIAVSGTGLPAVSLIPYGIAFGVQAVNTTSTIQTLTLTNNQLYATLSISSIAISGDSQFAINNPSTTCGASLAPGASCTIAVTFTPTSNGAQPNGTLTVSDNANNSPQTATLTGQGGVASSLSPSSVAYGNQVVNTTSATKTLTLHNLQSSPLSISSVLFSGPFQLDTSATTTCQTSGGTLAANSSCVIGVQFAPTAIGVNESGQITVFTNAANSPLSASLLGSGIRPVLVSPAVLPFGQVPITVPSASKNITVTNQQTTANLDFASITAPAPYTIVPGTTTCIVGTPVTPGNSCVISVAVTPTAVGALPSSDVVTISDDAANSPQTVSLTGTGVPLVGLSPNPVGFGTEVLNEKSTQTTTLTNYLSTALIIDSIGSFTGGYTLDTTETTCPMSPLTLAAGASCTIAFDDTPTTTGSQPGTAALIYNVVGTSSMVDLAITMQGSTIHPVAINPSAVTFPSQFIGFTSTPATTVKIVNLQSVALNISSIAIAGADPGDFAIVSNLCPTAPASLPAGATCSLTLDFTPTTSGERTAMLTVTDDAPGSPQSINLTGTGNRPVVVAPTSITNFGASVSKISAYQTVTITNNTSTSLTNINFHLSGNFEQTSTTCGAAAPYTLAGTSSCNVTISFAPTVGGTLSGQLQVTDSAATSPQVVNLQGNAVNPLVLSSTGLSFPAQLVNSSSAAKQVTLTNNQSQSASFSLATSGAFSASTNCTTGTIAANSSCLIYVSFSPTTTTPASQTGSVTVTDSAPNGNPLVISLTGAASATNPAPAVAVVSPGAAAGGTNVNVTITGNGWTHFSSSSVVSFVDTDSASYAPDITVNSVTALTPNTLTASLTIAASPVYGARNIKVVTPLTGGTSETASLESAFIISDPTQTFEITSITPGVGTQGQGYLGEAPLTVDIVASGTSFVQGTTFANFGDGITVESLDITGPTTAQAVLAITNTTSVGYRTLTMVTGGQVANSVLNNGNPLFYVGPNAATLTAVTMATVNGGVVTCTTNPVSVAQSFAGPVCLTATGTHFLQNATGVTITGGVTVGDTIVTSPTTAYSNVIVPAGATIGVDSVTVATGGEIATLNNSFTVTGSTPALISVAPNSAQQGATNVPVVITGNSYTAFNACPGGVLTADFTGVITTGTIIVNSANQVTVPITINENAPTGGITANLTCGGAGSATIFPFSFTILPSSASIVSVTPSSVPQGGQVTLSVVGSNTDWSQADTMAAFYPTPIATPLVNEVTVNSATTASLNISVPVNTPVGTYCFYMSTGGQIVSACIQVYANTPTLTMSPANGLLPTSGTNSFNVSFTGQFTSFSQAGTVTVIAGEGVTLSNFTVISPVSATGTINIAAGAATGSRLVTFTTGGQIVTTYFNVTTIPVGIVSVSPWNAAQSTTLNVAIVGLNTHFVSGNTQVIFGGPQITVNSVTVNSPTSLVANITTSYTAPGNVLTPTPPGWNAVYINDPTEQLITGFLVDAPATPSLVSACVTADLPSCVSSAPQGSGGTNVTITGSLTNWVQGSSELVMGAGVTVADLVITSPTSATATISVSPTAPVGGNSVIMITPLTGGGFEYDSGVGFSVTPSAAYISDVSLPACATTTDANFIANFCNTGTAGIAPVVSQLQTSMLDVTGVGTHWLQGETTLSFGPGVVVDQLTINSPTSATVQITVLSSAPVGYATATAYTDGENASLVQAIDIEEGSPTFLAFSPQGAQQGATLQLEVLGRFTNWSAATPPIAEFNQDITINSLTVVDSETLTMNVTVSPWAYVDTGSPCGHVLTITSGSEQVSSSQINDNFCVSTGAQEITGVSPNASGQGSSLQVTITGSQTNFLAGQTQVSFGDPGITVGVPTMVTPTSLVVPVLVTTTATPGFKTVTVTTYGQIATQADAFTASPTVAQLTEAIADQQEQGVQGVVVRLIGQYTHFSTASTATFGAGITVVGTPTWVSATEIDATINIDPLSYVGGRTVTVTTPNVSCANQPPTGLNIQGVTYQGCTPGVTTGTGKEIVDANVFSIIQGPAIITGVSPNTGNEGQEIVFNITGSATHWQQNYTQFYIAGGGSDITVNDVIINSATSATVDITISQTANAGPRSVYMITAGESLTDSGAFVVTGGVPAISYLTPNSGTPPPTGPSDLQVTIVGNAYTQWVQGTSTVNFGPGITVNTFEVTDSWHIAADITIGAACTAPNVPAGCAQYGYRTVVVQTGTQGLTGSFDVTPPPPPPTPYVWYEAPSSGIPGQTVSVYFYGANTEWNPDPTTGTTLTGWDANNITVNSYQIVSPTEATANITINSSAPGEGMALTFTTNGTTYNDGCTGCEVDNASFNIVIAQPTLTIVDPGSGLQGAQNITVNVLGQFTAFDSTTTFSFGGPGSGITVNGPPTILGPTIATQSISIGQETRTGGYSVVATTPDAPAIAQVVGGAGFSVTPSLASILSVSPNTSPQGTQISVDVTGFDTHWNPATQFSFGAGIVVTGVDVTSETTATLTLAIPALAPEGTTYAQATTAGEVATLNQAFVITAGTPYLLSSGPGTVEQQGSAVFTILAQATTWSAATPPVVSYGGNITLGPVQVTSPTTLTVQGAVAATAYPGYQNLTVTTGTQVLGINNAVYIAPGPAVINSVTPNTGGQGVTFSNVQITGINTNWVQGVTTLTFPGVLVNSFTVNSPTSITANITVNTTAAVGQVNVTATTLGEVANEVNAFNITQTQAEMAFIDPPSLAQGQTQNLTITGIDTTFVSGTSVVTSTSPGITINSTTVNSPTSITANVTVAPTIVLGYKNITVTTGGQIVSSNALFQVTNGPAAISGLNPSEGGEGNAVTVVVTGSQTHFSQGSTTASFAGGISVTGITVQSLTQATVNIQIPNSVPVGTYNVTLTTGGEVATILGGFTVGNGAPSITNVNPPTGTQGITENVTLTGQFTSWIQGSSNANFGSGITVNSTTINGGSSAVANITISTTATLGSRTVSMITGGETDSIVGGFTVLAGVPALVSSSPGSGQAGTTVNLVITGVFTTFQQGLTSVSLGDGISTNFVTVADGTQLTANVTIPSNATVGSTYVSVNTNGSTLTLNNAFTVLAGTPEITQINPNVGTTGQTLNVNIVGLYTNWMNGTTVASFGGSSSGITVNSTTVSSTNSLTANITISGTAALGPVGVTTTTNSEVENVAGGFTIESPTPPSPQVISLSPGASAGGMPLNSAINAVFSEPMLRSSISSTTVLLSLTSNPGGWVSVPGTVTLDPTGRIVTFEPSSLLAPNSTYYFNITSTVESATDVSLGNYAVYLYTTSSTASTGPTVVAANPPALSTVGTNVTVQLDFSADMLQGTETGVTVSTGGTPVAGTYSWNANPYCCGSGWAQPGTVLTFTPTAPLTASTTYTVAWNATVTDTAGNAAVPGSFTFNTGSGPDTTENYASTNFNGQTNVGTNFAPTVTYSKPVNPLDIWGGWNSGTLQLWDYDGSKYVEGTVTVAPNGLSATFTPTVPLLPDTYYQLYQAWGDYDVDGNYLNGLYAEFTTGVSTDTTQPTVTFVSPANTATSVPLNTQIVVKFSAPINDNNINVVAVTPAGGSAIQGTASLAGDLVTLTFTPASALPAGKVFTVDVSGYTDIVGNSGVAYSSTFTTTASPVLLNLSTGLNSSGQVIIPISGCGGASPEPACPTDANWTVVPTGPVGGPTTDEALGLYVATATTTPAATGPSQPLYIVGPGDAGWWTGGWPADGPQSDWINMYPASEYSDTFGVYSTNFNMPSTVPSNLCLVGQMSIDDNGTLGIVNSANPSGIAITGNINTNTSFTGLNIPISSFLVPGSNTLALAWGSTDNNYEAFRLQADIETCGASVTGGLSITSSTPSNNTTGVSTGTTIVMNFNNPVDPATVNTTRLPVMVGWNSNQEISGTYAFSNNNTTVTFTPASPFPNNTNIWVGACGGPLDLAGDSLGGCYTQEFNFTTGPTVTAAGSGLQVAAYSPAANATDVGLRAPVYVTFNRSINLGSINNSDFGLYDGYGVGSGYSQTSPWCYGGSYLHSQDDATIYWNCFPLPSSSQLTMVLTGGISDWEGETLSPFTNGFSTAQYDSNTNGSIISVRPGNGASGVNPNLPLVLYSNLPLNASTASSGIQVAQNNVIVPGNVQVLDSGYSLVFTPTVPFTNGALIQWWTTGSLFDTTYNTPINGDSGYYYTAASTSTATPTVQVASPGEYTNPIPTNAVFDVQFNTPINASTISIAGTPSIYVYDSSTGLNIPVTYSQPQPNEVLMTPTSFPLPSNHYLYVYVTTALQSTTSVPAAATDWWEYTGTATDTTLPMVTSAVPYNGATNVAVNDTPGIIVSKTIDPISVTSTTFQVLNGGTPLAGSYWFNSGDTRVDFVPNSPLPPGATLTMSINGITDLEGHPITFSSSFGTGAATDFTAPTVLFSSVNSNESIPTNSTIAVTFSEPMDATTFSAGSPSGCNNFYIEDQLSGDGINCIATTLTWNSSQTIAYLTPTSPLSAGREYYFWVGSGTDLAGNAMSSDGFSFYADFTGSSAAPSIVAFNPIGGKTGLGTNTVIEAEFSAPIDPNYMSGVTLTNGGSPVPANVYAIDGNTVIEIVPTVPLQPTTTYTMNVAGVKDPAGNVVATETNSFTTGASYDITSPTVVETVPVNGASVGTNIVPKLVFNKPLNPLTVNNSGFQLYLNDTGQFIPSTVTLSPSGLEVTITPQIPLLPNTEYYFFGGNGVVHDEDGNYYPQTNYAFWTTGGTDTTSPTVAISPANGSTGIPINSIIEVAVSTPVDPTTITQSSITLMNGSTPVSGTVTLANAQLLIFTPTTTATSAAQTYLGCFNDDENGARALNGYSWSSNQMTIEQCVSSCASQGSEYAGVEYGSNCYCGSGNFSSQGTSTSCNEQCTGNSAETCGGSNAAAVYTAQSEAVHQNLAAGASYTVNVSGFSDSNGNLVTPGTSTFTTAGTASSSGLVLTST